MRAPTPSIVCSTRAQRRKMRRCTGWQTRVKSCRPTARRCSPTRRRGWATGGRTLTHRAVQKPCARNARRSPSCANTGRHCGRMPRSRATNSSPRLDVAQTPGLTSVVIVAADSGEDLAVCIESVLASTAPVEAIVSDNDSRDGSIQALAARWQNDPRLRILRNDANLGFGAGCNRGAAQARGDALLFLNPDCLVEPDTIARLRGFMAPDIGLLGASIVGSDDKPEPASRRRDPFLRRIATSMFGLGGVDRSEE